MEGGGVEEVRMEDGGSGERRRKKGERVHTHKPVQPYLLVGLVRMRSKMVIKNDNFRWLYSQNSDSQCQDLKGC